MAHLGIDLGTSNTLVALVNGQGTPEVQRIDGETMVPSFIYIEDAGANAVVGKVAQDMWADPEYDSRNSFRRWKMSIGEPAPAAPADTPRLSPEKLTTLMVEYIVGHISAGLGGETIESVLVTVPHGWRRQTPEKCRITRQAAAQASIGGQSLTVRDFTVSEPVAAAAYWIWEHRKRSEEQGAAELDGKAVLVCDIGGGTFDLSLVRVGGEDRPLDVVDASNSAYAGDYMDALICAWMCRQYNETHGQQCPDSAEGILAAISSQAASATWLRRWLLQAQSMKEKMSLRLENEKDLNKIRAIKESFSDSASRHTDVRFNVEEFFNCLDPFYQHGKDLLTRFLNGNATECPYAAVFCGGGSKLAGIRERVVRTVLEELYGQLAATDVLKRIEVNAQRVDEAIALGAALIANGDVSVQERLLHNVGIVMQIGSHLLAKDLDLPGTDQDFLLSPILQKGMPLPAAVSSKDLGLNASPKPKSSLDVQVVIEDDTEDPLIQEWNIPHPGGGGNRSLEWQVAVDAEGELRVTLLSSEGRAESRIGRLDRPLSGPNRLIVGPRDSKVKWVRISPERLKNSIDDLGKKGKR